MADEQKANGEKQGQPQGETKVQSSTPDNAEKKLNPSAPGETGTTPGTNDPQN